MSETAVLIVTKGDDEITPENIEFALRIYDVELSVLTLERVPAEDDKTNDGEVDDAVPV